MRTGSPPTLRGYDDLLIYLPSPCVIADRDRSKISDAPLVPFATRAFADSTLVAAPGRYKIVLFFFKNRVLCVFLQARSRDPTSMPRILNPDYAVARSPFALMSLVHFRKLLL